MFVPLFEPGVVIDLIEEYGVNWTVMVPTMIGMLLDHPDFTPERIQTLKTLIYGASPMPMPLLQRLIATMFPEVELGRATA